MPHSKYSKKQKKLAAVAPPRKKITGADLKKLRKKWLYDVEKGSLSDDPSNLNKLRKTAKQLRASMNHAKVRLEQELQHIDMLVERLDELSEEVYQEYSD